MSATYTTQADSSKNTETDEESDEIPEDAVTTVTETDYLIKVCLDCSEHFTTKCKHCAGCRNCRKNTKCHFYECFGDKICAICGHCFDGEVCKICCPYCGQVYPTGGHWRRHVRVTHLGLDTRPSIARKRRAKASLTTRKKDSPTDIQLAVDKEKTSKCLTCGKCFMNPHKLKRHVKIHSEVKDFKCHVCGKGFVQKVHLQKHLLQHGIGEKRFKCHNCDKWFNHKISLKTHMPKCTVNIT